MPRLAPWWDEWERPVPEPPGAPRRESALLPLPPFLEPHPQPLPQWAAASAIPGHQFVKGGKPPFTLSPAVPRPSHSLGRNSSFWATDGGRYSLERGVEVMPRLAPW